VSIGPSLPKKRLIPPRLARRGVITAKRVNKLNSLLVSMRFDLAKALYRWEQQRLVVAPT
jgi:hypothetical protein